MTVASHVSVTMSADLLRHLRERANGLGVPVRLIIAGLVCDTIESLAVKAVNAPGQRVLRRISSFPVFDIDLFEDI